MPGFNIGKVLSGCNLQYGTDQNDFLPNTIETARSNRFELILIPPNVGPLLFDSRVAFACESISRPVVRSEKEQVFNGTDYINVPLRVKYEPIEITLYEILKPTSHGNPDETSDAYNLTALDMWDWWTQSVFDPNKSRMTYPNSRRSTIQITMFSGAGALCWSYELYRAWPEAIVPSGLDYKTGAISKLVLTVSYDKYKEIRPKAVP